MAAGFIAFFLSPVADNLTTALLMAMVVAAVGGEYTRFVAIGCINIVVAANAGGAFSPFGDITTLMVWQQGIIGFQEFFVLFIPALAGWLVTAGIMSFAVSGERPVPVEERAELRKGAWIVVGLFILTICMAVSFHNILHMPPVLGMMTGLGMLKLFGFYLQMRGDERFDKYAEKNLGTDEPIDFDDLPEEMGEAYRRVQLIQMGERIGGSMLSIGSAAGVAVMGQARGVYTFFTHLKWSWAILLGYIISIWVHFIVNAGAFVT